MGIGSSLKKLHKKVDPIGSKLESKTKSTLGLSKSGSGSPPIIPTSQGSAGSDVGDAGVSASRVRGTTAMDTARNTAGSRSGVGRLQKGGYT